MKNIICMKWGTKFPPFYVNRLASMVQRNLAPPYRFVCFTEDGNGLDPEIEVFPLPELTLDKNLPERGWRKLTILGPTAAELQGNVLFLDLDVVIMQNLEPFFEQSGKFLIAHEWGFQDSVIGNSSVFRFESGQHQDVLEYYVRHGETVRKQHRNEQAYLSHSIHDKGILQYWPDSWCRSFKRASMRSFPLCHFLPPIKPTDTKILVFHGNPNPDAALNGWTGHFGLRAVRHADWIREYWY